MQAFLSGVPIDNRLVIDVDSYSFATWNVTSAYFGSYFVWSYGNNDGGRPGIYSNLQRVRAWSDPVCV